MSPRPIRTAVFLVLASFSLVAYAQTPATNNAIQSELDAKALLKEVAEKYQAMQRYQFSVQRTTSNETHGNGLVSRQHGENRFELAVEEGNRFRLESITPYEKSLVSSDGVTRFTYLPQLKQFIKRDANTEVVRPATMSAVSDPTYYVMQQRTLISRLQQLGGRSAKISLVGESDFTVNGQTVSCFIVQVGTLTNGFGSEQKLWIDKTRKLVLREWNHSRTKNGDTATLSESVTQYDYTPIKVNEPLPAELFTFAPPVGVNEVAEFKRAEPLARTTPNLNGKEALPFALKDLKGNNVELAAYKGKVVLLDFWASWCGPCVAELPHIQKLHNQFKDKGLVILGINAEELEVAQGFMKAKGYTFSSLVDQNHVVSKQYQVNGIPQVFIINREGVIKWSARGYVAGRELELKAAIEKLLNNEEPPVKTSLPTKTPPPMPQR